MTHEFGGRAQRCATQLKAEGLDLAAYNPQESADDIEDLRKALGVEQVALFGFSPPRHLLGTAVLKKRQAGAP
jgi:hypothetical protein